MSTDDVYKPTTELLRTLYGHLGRTGYYVPQDELDGRCAAFNRWLESVRRAAWKEGHADGLCDGVAFECHWRDGTPFIPTRNPYGKETP